MKMRWLALWVMVSFFAAYLVDGIFGALPTYTEKEKIKLEEFRGAMGDALYKDYMKTDFYLIRWLKASNFDLRSAKQALTKALNWRKKNNIDGLENEKLFDFSYPLLQMDGHTRKGGFLLTSRPGKVLYRDALLNRRRDQLIRKMNQVFEILELETMKAMGIIGNSSRPDAYELSTFVWDMSGFNLRQNLCLGCVQVYMQQIRDIIDYYPGYIDVFVAVNLPRIAVPLAELVKPLAKRVSKQEPLVYGPDKDDWLPVLRKIAAPDQWRRHLGGTRPD